MVVAGTTVRRTPAEASERRMLRFMTENLGSVGQMIIGGLETVGGILTANSTTREEGAFNLEAGELRQEANKNLTAMDDAEEEKTNED